jgi:hypothetical protein
MNSSIVSRSEYDFLSIAQAIVRKEHVSSIESLLRSSIAMNKTISPVAMHIFKNIVSKGSVLALMQRGGYQHKIRFLSEKKPNKYRSWQAPKLCNLHFSPFTYELFQWLAVTPLSHTTRVLLQSPLKKTMLDDFLLYLTFDTLKNSPLIAIFASQPAVRQSSLCWLAFTDILATVGRCELQPHHFEMCTQDEYVYMLDAIGTDVAKNIVKIEEKKAPNAKTGELIAIGNAQEFVNTIYKPLQRKINII